MPGLLPLIGGIHIAVEFFFLQNHAQKLDNSSGYQFRPHPGHHQLKQPHNSPYINPVKRCQSLFTSIKNLVKNGAKLDEETIDY